MVRWNLHIVVFILRTVGDKYLIALYDSVVPLIGVINGYR